MEAHDAGNLCLECGLCCNGVIFAKGQLQPADDLVRLKSLGLRLAPKSDGPAGRKFVQPCAAFDGCRCRIYAERPHYCREFECLLLKGVQSGRMESKAALRIIRTARKRAEKVKGLLSELGEDSDATALSLRFQRVKRDVESGPLDEQTANLFGQLTLAVHELNLILSEAFYPGAE